jgi:hypothetical protein
MWQMAIGAGIGALLGGASYLDSSRKNQKEIRRQQGLAEKAYGFQTDYNNRMYGLQKGEALATLGIQQNRLRDAFGMDVQGFNLGLEGQALGNQAARVGLSESTGMARAAQGASGTRGGSLDTQIAYHEDQFSRQMDLQERGNSLSMQGMASQYTNAWQDIGREEASWSSGGWRHESKLLGDAYAANMHGLQMDEYDHAYKDAGFNMMDFLAAGLGGAASGAGLGAQVGGFMQQVGNPGKQAGDAGTANSAVQGGAAGVGIGGVPPAAPAAAGVPANVPGMSPDAARYAAYRSGSVPAANVPAAASYAAGTRDWANSLGLSGMSVDVNGYWNYLLPSGYATWAFPGIAGPVRRID